jgi:hypothetical protein
MLSEMTSTEVSEWRAYFAVKERYAEQDRNENAERAKERAKKNNF